MFLYAEQAIAYHIEDAYTRQVIKPFCNLNFDMIGRPYPKLKFASIEKTDMAKVSEIVHRMLGSKAVEPDEELESYLRKLLGWPRKGKPRQPIDAPDNPAGRPSEASAGNNARVNQGDNPRAE
jgi:hypothetical protein